MPTAIKNFGNEIFSHINIIIIINKIKFVQYRNIFIIKS